MVFVSHLEAELDKQRLQINREELLVRITRAIKEDGLLEVFPGVFLSRFSRPPEPMHAVYKPAFAVIAQGSKEVLLGEEVFRYDPGHYLITTVALPIVSRVVEATEKKPYLSLRLNLDPVVVASVMMESGIEPKKSDHGVMAMDVSPIDADLLDAVVNLARLLDRPDEVNFLAPLIIREIIYRLLKGEQGARLSHLLVSERDTPHFKGSQTAPGKDRPTAKN